MRKISAQRGLVLGLRLLSWEVGRVICPLVHCSVSEIPWGYLPQIHHPHVLSMYLQLIENTLKCLLHLFPCFLAAFVSFFAARLLKLQPCPGLSVISPVPGSEWEPGRLCWVNKKFSSVSYRREPGQCILTDLILSYIGTTGLGLLLDLR